MHTSVRHDPEDVIVAEGFEVVVDDLHLLGGQGDPGPEQELAITRNVGTFLITVFYSELPVDSYYWLLLE